MCPLEATLALLLLLGTLQSARCSSIDQQLLGYIESYIDDSVDACNDYFKYACGNWSNRHQSERYSEVTGLVDYKINQNFVKLMAELKNRIHSPTSMEAQLINFYESCRTAPSETRLGLHYLELVGPDEGLPWPQLAINPEFWPAYKFNWLRTLAQLRRYGLSNVLMRVDVVPHFFDSNKFVINLDRPTFEKEDMLNSVILTKRLLLRMGVPSKKTLKLARDIKRLELLVMQLIEEDDEPNDDVSVKKLQRDTDIDWRKFLEVLLGHHVSHKYVVQVQNVPYFKSLAELLQSQPADVVATYIMMRFVLYVLNESMSDNEDIACLQDVRRNMNLAMNLLYEEHYYGAKLQQYNREVRSMFDMLREELLTKVERNSLRLKSAQVHMIKNKIRSMNINIGQMPTQMDHRSFVEHFYKDLSLDTNDYAVNHLKLLNYRTKQLLKLLNKPSARTEDYIFVTVDSDTDMSSTPYYMLRQNTIIVPYGILQEPIYHADSHDIFKLSLLGFLLGHEIIHGFDTSGLVFDAAGNGNELGVEIADNRHFTAALGCLTRAETDSLDERVADISGIRLAYDAYFGQQSNYSQVQPSFTKLPLKKLFFLNMAQFFCGDLQTSFQDHDTDDVRLRQTLSNFLPFAEAYECRRSGHQMNPPEKCRLWR